MTVRSLFMLLTLFAALPVSAAIAKEQAPAQKQAPEKQKPAAKAVSKPSRLDLYRKRTITVFGNDPCPVSKRPDEVIVCARRPEEERYRLPRLLREDELKQRDKKAKARLRATMDAGRTGGGSCSNVGPAGGTGCLEQEIERSRALAEETREQNNPTIPDELRRPR